MREHLNLGPAHTSSVDGGQAPWALKGRTKHSPLQALYNPLTRPCSLIGSTVNVQTGPELSEDRRGEALGEDVGVL